MTTKNICEGSGDVGILAGALAYPGTAPRYIEDAVIPNGRGVTAECSWCHKTVSVNLDGTLRRHFDDGNSIRKPQEVRVPDASPTTNLAEREREIVLAYQKGSTINDIVQRFNLTGPPAVYALLSRAKASGAANGRGDPSPDTEALKAGIRADYENGMPFTEIRSKHGVGTERLRSMINEMGLERPSRVRTSEPEPAEPEPEPSVRLSPRDQKIVGEYLAGTSTTSIQSDFGISPGQLYRLLDKAGVKPGRTKAAEEPAQEVTQETTLHEVRDLDTGEIHTYTDEEIAEVEHLQIPVEPEEELAFGFTTVPTNLHRYRGRRVTVVYEDFELLAEDFFGAVTAADRENSELLTLELAE